MGFEILGFRLTKSWECVTKKLLESNKMAWVLLNMLCNFVSSFSCIQLSFCILGFGLWVLGFGFGLWFRDWALGLGIGLWLWDWAWLWALLGLGFGLGLWVWVRACVCAMDVSALTVRA